MSYKNHNQKLLCQKRYRESHKEQARQYYLKNREKIRKRQKEKYYKNWEKTRKLAKEKYLKNREKILRQEEKRRRKMGQMPLGKSIAEEKIYKGLLIVFKPQDIKRRERRIIKNSITGRWLELDFYIPSRKIAIEVDGEFHRIPRYGEKRLNIQLKNDEIKTKECEKLGIKLVRIPFGRDVGLFGEKIIIKLKDFKKIIND